MYLWECAWLRGFGGNVRLGRFLGLGWMQTWGKLDEEEKNKIRADYFASR